MPKRFYDDCPTLDNDIKHSKLGSGVTLNRMTDLFLVLHVQLDTMSLVLSMPSDRNRTDPALRSILLVLYCCSEKNKLINA